LREEVEAAISTLKKRKPPGEYNATAKMIQDRNVAHVMQQDLSGEKLSS
jgi:hypothetical protein